jgi:hypothetical protein
MEALLVREGNHYAYKSSTLTISSSIDQIATILALQVDGFSTTVSLGNQVQKGYKYKVENYCMQGKLLYHLGKICIPTSERVHVIREAYTSLVYGNFGVGKTMAHLQRFCYWPQMKVIITKYVKGHVMCSTHPFTCSFPSMGKYIHGFCKGITHDSRGS